MFQIGYDYPSFFKIRIELFWEIQSPKTKAGRHSDLNVMRILVYRRRAFPRSIVNNNFLTYW